MFVSIPPLWLGSGRAIMTSSGKLLNYSSFLWGNELVLKLKLQQKGKSMEGELFKKLLCRVWLRTKCFVLIS